MDFFSSQHDSRLSSTTSASNTDPFAQEIGRRFSQPILTARLSPVVAPQSPAPSSSSTTTATIPAYPGLSSSPKARLNSLSLRSKPTTPAPLDSRISAVDPASLPSVLETPHILVLDIRPHATFAQSRLPHALSLSVPSTLLKRPAFPLDKLTEMLSSPAGRRKFSTWKSASRILVYDADSLAIPDGSNIRGLLRKFDSEGFRGDLSWLKGGFAAVWRERRHLVDNGPPSPDSSEEEESTMGYLRTRKLPSSAFQQSSTTSASHRPAQTPGGIYPTGAAPPPMSTRTVAANPFYDNIRQNRELEHGITERIPLRLPSSVIARKNDLPFDWLREIVDKADAEEGTESLAMQFYMIELREQRRLMGVMDHHSKEGNSGAQKGIDFPFSITAGVEKGSKNRYTNIWPFEHARVRLKSCLDDGSDYINASHVHPIGTRRRYIATQGPLPATYTDFWTLCWEQNVSVIVMLTKQIEGSLEKCGCYWRQNVYGPLRLELVSTTGDDDTSTSPLPQLQQQRPSGFDFGIRTEQPVSLEKSIVRRTFMLSHINHPEVPPRKVTQLQYLGWPDYDVPEDPKGLLELMKQVDELRSETDSSDPVLLHCSAGIGRTGGYIMVDAALDGIRYEMGKRRQGKVREERPRTPVREQKMDVDVAPVQQQQRTISMSSTAPAWNPRSPPNVASIRLSDSEGSEPHESSPSRGKRPPSTIVSQGSRSVGGSSAANGLLPSVFPSGAELRMPQPKPRKVFVPLLGDAQPQLQSHPQPYSQSHSQSESRADLRQPSDPESSATGTSTNVPSIFTARSSRDRSTVPTSVPLSVESSRSTSPPPSAEPLQTLLAKKLAAASNSPPDLNPKRDSSRDSNSPPGPHSNNSPPNPARNLTPALDPQNPHSTFDYTDPRRLHNNASPKLLSELNEPVRSILEDMREQRMSLCQSLRQYVFVHRAIVEGALEMVDEERKMGGRSSQTQQGQTHTQGQTHPPSHSQTRSQPLHSPQPQYTGTGTGAGTGIPSPTTMMMDGIIEAAGWKRGPSPTELLPMDKKGAERLVKRPSFKRRDRSDVSSIASMATECPAAK